MLGQQLQQQSQQSHAPSSASESSALNSISNSNSNSSSINTPDATLAPVLKKQKTASAFEVMLSGDLLRLVVPGP